MTRASMDGMTATVGIIWVVCHWNPKIGVVTVPVDLRGIKNPWRHIFREFTEVTTRAAGPPDPHPLRVTPIPPFDTWQAKDKICTEPIL
jgi:hypothetical protein